jgi:hypothetical protein
MPWKFLWYALVAIGFVASFFFDLSIPKNWESTLSVLAPIETWWAAHATHPSLSALFVGLAVSTVLLPELWSQIRPHIFPPKLRPDVDGATAFKEIIAKSRRAKALIRTGQLTIPLRYESHLTGFEINEGRLKAQIADEFHDFLRSGEITAWGTPDGRKPHQEIKPEEWSEIEIDFNDRDMDSSPSHVHAVKRGNRASGSAFGYVWIRLCRKQVRGVFPLAWFPRKIKDEPKEKS